MMLLYHLKHLQLRTLASLLWVAVTLSACAQFSPVPEQSWPSLDASGHAKSVSEEAYLQAAEKAFIDQDYRTAKRLFASILNTNPAPEIKLTAQYGLAACADMLNNFELSESIYQTLAASQRDTAIWLNNYGYSKLLQGHYMEAHNLFTKALTINPQHLHSQANLHMLRHTLQQSLQGPE